MQRLNFLPWKLVYPINYQSKNEYKNIVPVSLIFQKQNWENKKWKVFLFSRYLYY